MKTLKYLFLIIFTVYVSSSYGTPKEQRTIQLDDEQISIVSKKIFEAVKKKDYPKLQDVVISKSEMLELISKSNESEESKTSMKADINNNLKISYSQIRTSFLDIIKKAEEDGVVWEQAEYFDNEYQISKKAGIQKLELTIKFKFKGIEYSFFNSNLLKANLGWKIIGDFSWGTLANGYAVDSTVTSVSESNILTSNVELSTITSDENFKVFFSNFKSNIEKQSWSLAMLSMSTSHIQDERTHMSNDYDYMNKVFDDWSFIRFGDGRVQQNPKMKAINYIKTIDYTSKGILNFQTCIFMKVIFLDGSSTQLIVPIVLENNYYKFESGRG